MGQLPQPPGRPWAPAAQAAAMNGRAVCLVLLALAAQAEEAVETTSAPGPESNAKTASFAISVMLMGAVAFIMMLFYLLHHPDDDLRAYIWNVVSMSICTFIGVLIGMSWSTSFTSFVVGPPEVAGVANTMAMSGTACIGWYIVLQIVLAVVAGAWERLEQKAELDRVKTVLDLKCFAVLCGVTTGASNLNFWGFLQQQVARDTWHLLSVPLLCVVSLWALFKVGECVRVRISRNDDGAIDDFEGLWNRYAMETEDGALAIATSHLIVQVVRFEVSGVLPLAGGQIRPGFRPSRFDAKLLFVMGGLWLLMIPIVDVMVNTSNKRVLRYKGWCKRIAANCVGFSWLYAITWELEAATDLAGPPLAMVLALVVTLFGFFLIFVMDSVVDLPCTGEATDREIKAMVTPISLLVGFSWKQAFAASVVAINGQTHILHPALQTLFMALVLALVVVPAWRMHILPVVMAGEVAKQEKRQEFVRRSSRAASGSSRGVPLLIDHHDTDPDSRKGAASRSRTERTSGSVGFLVVDEAQQPEVEPSRPDPLSPDELLRQNSFLAQRNADLECYIREIQKELGHLKRLLALVQ